MSDPLRIAYFSPLPPAQSGIADYSADLLPELARRTELTLFTSELTAPTFSSLPLAPIDEYPQRRWEFDLALYQMGNSHHHEQIYRMLLRYPGVVVLHDLFLHHFVAHRTAGQQDTAAYARELSYALGEDGRRLYDEIRTGLRPSPLAEVTLNNRLLDTSLAAIVHSDFAQSRILEHNPGLRTAVVPQVVAHHQGQSRRAELELPDDGIVFGSIGQITASRQMPLVLHALRKLLDQGMAAHLLLVGEALPEVDLDGEIARLGLASAVTRIGYVPSFEDFTDWIATMDVVVNLRVPTLGETSASVLRAMDAGRPVIVSDHGWYSELPDAAALKVPVAADAVTLFEAMTLMTQDPLRRQAMGLAAESYIARTGRPSDVAEKYVDFLNSLRDEWRYGP